MSLDSSSASQGGVKPPVNGLIVKALRALQRDYLVIGKTRVRGWQSWLVLGFAAGLATGIVVIANRTGQVEPSIGVVADTTAPATPSGLTAAAGDSEVVLSWTANTEPDLSHYAIRYAVTGTTAWLYIQGIDKSVTSYTIGQLVNGTSYDFQIRAVDTSGNRSAWSSSVTATPAPVASSLTFVASADTYVSKETPTQNFGTSLRLEVDGNPRKITYLLFDLSGLGGKTVESAKFRINIIDEPGAGSSSTQALKLVSSTTWSETGMTWGNRPSLGTTVATISGGLPGQLLELDLTSTVKAYAGKKLALAINSSGDDGIAFQSRESASGRPRIIAYLSTPTADTLTVDLTARLDNSQSWQQSFAGTVPVSGLDLRASVGGTATGPIIYTFYCNRSDDGTTVTSPWSMQFNGVSTNPQTALDLCNYGTAGTYTAKVIVQRGSAPPAEDRVTVTVNTSPTSTAPVLLGIWPPGLDYDELIRFEGVMGRKAAVYRERGGRGSINQDLYKSNMLKAVSDGRIASLEVNCRLDNASNYISYTRCMSGEFDDNLRRMAHQAIELGPGPHFIEVQSEANVYNSSGTITEFQQFFRYVHDIFVREGVRNLLWTVTLTHQVYDKGMAAEWYKGIEDIVDVVGVDGYSTPTEGFGGQIPGKAKSPAEILEAARVFAASIGKPVASMEIGVQEDLYTPDPSYKANWYAALGTYLEQHQSDFAAIVFNTSDDGPGGPELTWSPESSSQALSAFRTLANSAVFGGK